MLLGALLPAFNIDTVAEEVACIEAFFSSGVVSVRGWEWTGQESILGQLCRNILKEAHVMSPTSLVDGLPEGHCRGNNLRGTQENQHRHK